MSGYSCSRPLEQLVSMTQVLSGRSSKLSSRSISIHFCAHANSTHQRNYTTIGYADWGNRRSKSAVVDSTASAGGGPVTPEWQLAKEDDTVILITAPYRTPYAAGVFATRHGQGPFVLPPSPPCPLHFPHDVRARANPLIRHASTTAQNPTFLFRKV